MEIDKQLKRLLIKTTLYFSSLRSSNSVTAPRMPKCKITVLHIVICRTSPRNSGLYFSVPCTVAILYAINRYVILDIRFPRPLSISSKRRFASARLGHLQVVDSLANKTQRPGDVPNERRRYVRKKKQRDAVDYKMLFHKAYHHLRLPHSHHVQHVIWRIVIVNNFAFHPRMFRHFHGRNSHGWIFCQRFRNYVFSLGARVNTLKIRFIFAYVPRDFFLGFSEKWKAAG